LGLSLIFKDFGFNSLSEFLQIQANEKSASSVNITDKHQNGDVLKRLFGEYNNRVATQMID
jgi:hypothetical protein